MKTNFEVRYASNPIDAKSYDTTRLRKDFLIEKFNALGQKANVGLHGWSVLCQQLFPKCDGNANYLARTGGNKAAHRCFSRAVDSVDTKQGAGLKGSEQRRVGVAAAAGIDLDSSVPQNTEVAFVCSTDALTGSVMLSEQLSLQPDPERFLQVLPEKV